MPAACLNRISGNQVDGAAGVITYTQWLNETRYAGSGSHRDQAERTSDILVVVTDTMVRHAETWLKRHIPQGAHAVVTDVTSAYGQLNVQGPNSRALLQKLTTADLSNAGIPVPHRPRDRRSASHACCASVSPISASSATSSTCPPSRRPTFMTSIVAAGREVRLCTHAGLKALASLRMEKGYRDYGHDIDNTDVPYEVGLGFALDLNKAGGFIGKEAVLANKAAGPLTRRLVQVLVKDPRAAHVPRRGGDGATA